ncbi:ATP-binding cassette domain-containing protein [Neptunicella sp.]|uniref:ABC transporter ATP-binding protein n=1 Tax=Neptunicella sp. TaxID=2125986 RepID=UPI003F68F607
MSILQLTNVSKAYSNTPVLDGVNLSLRSGQVMGLIGHNGSGKTTLIKTALGLLQADSGSAQLWGNSAWELSADNKQKLGFVPQTMDSFNGLTAKQLIEYCGAFYNHWDSAKAKQLMVDWQLNEKQLIGEMSEGQRQRLAIISGLSHSPTLLVLDEPAAALDPSARRQLIKQLIDMNSDSQTSILFSTHITSDIERVASDVAFLKDGKVIFQGAIDELKEKVVRLHISGENLPHRLSELSCLNQQIKGNKALLSVTDYSELLHQQLIEKLQVSVDVEYLNMEDIFLEIDSCTR